LVVAVVVVTLMPHQLTMVVVEVVLVHIEQEQHQSEHIQYQQLFRLGEGVLAVLLILLLLVQVMLEQNHILEHLLHHLVEVVVVMENFQTASYLVMVDLVVVVVMQALPEAKAELAIHSQEQ
jgi:hypothetical protein